MPAQLTIPHGQSGQRFSVAIKDAAFLQVGAAFEVSIVDVRLDDGKSNLSLEQILESALFPSLCFRCATSVFCPTQIV